MSHVICWRARGPGIIERVPSEVFSATACPEARAGIAVWATFQAVELAGDVLGGSSVIYVPHRCRGSPLLNFREVSHETFH